MDHPTKLRTNEDQHNRPPYNDHTGRPSTVIIGAGVIGCATAYYLSESKSAESGQIHLIESSPELFASASGKSGGFLTSDWFGPETASLGELSFRLHRQLADQYDGFDNWGYSRSTGTSLVAGGQSDGPRGEDWLFSGGSRAEAAGFHEFKGDETGPAWLTKQKGDQVEVIGKDGGVAQVDPLRLCQFLLRQSVANGVQLHQPAEAATIDRDANEVMSAIQIRRADNTTLRIPCSRLLITAGAWTPRVFDQLFPSASVEVPVSPLAGHSLIVKSPRWTREHESRGCHAVFTTTRSGLSPEIFSRIGEEIYVAGLNDADIPLPERPTDAQIDPACIDELKRVSQQFLGQDGTDVSDLQIVREGLCFRPVTKRGVPILARIADDVLGGVKTSPSPVGGVYISAGHGPWGISHSLGTGKVMAEMLEGQRLSANVRALGLQPK